MSQPIFTITPQFCARIALIIHNLGTFTLDAVYGVPPHESGLEPDLKRALRRPMKNP